MGVYINVFLIFSLLISSTYAQLFTWFIPPSLRDSEETSSPPNVRNSPAPPPAPRGEHQGASPTHREEPKSTRGDASLAYLQPTGTQQREPYRHRDTPQSYRDTPPSYRDTTYRDTPPSYRDTDRDTPPSYRDTYRGTAPSYRDTDRDTPLSYRDTYRDTPLSYRDTYRDTPPSYRDTYSSTTQRHEEQLYLNDALSADRPPPEYSFPMLQYVSYDTRPLQPPERSIPTDEVRQFFNRYDHGAGSSQPARDQRDGNFNLDQNGDTTNGMMTMRQSGVPTPRGGGAGAGGSTSSTGMPDNTGADETMGQPDIVDTTSSQTNADGSIVQSSVGAVDEPIMLANGDVVEAPGTPAVSTVVVVTTSSTAYLKPGKRTPIVQFLTFLQRNNVSGLVTDGILEAQDQLRADLTEANIQPKLTGEEVDTIWETITNTSQRHREERLNLTVDIADQVIDNKLPSLAYLLETTTTTTRSTSSSTTMPLPEINMTLMDAARRNATNGEVPVADQFQSAIDTGEAMNPGATLPPSFPQPTDTGELSQLPSLNQGVPPTLIRNQTIPTAVPPQPPSSRLVPSISAADSAGNMGRDEFSSSAMGFVPMPTHVRTQPPPPSSSQRPNIDTPTSPQQANTFYSPPPSRLVPSSPRPSPPSPSFTHSHSIHDLMRQHSPLHQYPWSSRGEHPNTGYDYPPPGRTGTINNAPPGTRLSPRDVTQTTPPTSVTPPSNATDNTPRTTGIDVTRPIAFPPPIDSALTRPTEIDQITNGPPTAEPQGGNIPGESMAQVSADDTNLTQGETPQGTGSAPVAVNTTGAVIVTNGSVALILPATSTSAPVSKVEAWARYWNATTIVLGETIGAKYEAKKGPKQAARAAQTAALEALADDIREARPAIENTTKFNKVNSISSSIEDFLTAQWLADWNEKASNVSTSIFDAIVTTPIHGNTSISDKLLNADPSNVQDVISATGDVIIAKNDLKQTIDSIKRQHSLFTTSSTSTTTTTTTLPDQSTTPEQSTTSTAPPNNGSVPQSGVLSVLTTLRDAIPPIGTRLNPF